MSAHFRLVPIGGLGNRLRSILSYRAAKGPLEVLWCNSSAVHGGWFLDVFEPLDNVTFTYCGDGHAHDLKLPNDALTCSLAPDAPEGWTKAYREIVPRMSESIEISLIEATLGTYNAVHARRTDHVEHASKHGHFTTNDELLTWHQQRGSPALFVATDCPDTQAWFRARADVRARGTIDRVTGYEQRPGKLRDAVIDMFVCASAEHFRGSWYSSFSETIEAIRCQGVYPSGFDPAKHMPSVGP